MLIGFAAALGSALLFGVAAVWQASAVRNHHDDTAAWLSFARMAVTSPLLLAVVGAYLGGFVLHAVAIWHLPLYLAQATMSLSMPVTAVWSAHKLAEPMGRGGWSAVAAVTLGIAVVAAGAGAPGGAPTGRGLLVLLWLLLLGCVVVGSALLGRPRPVALGLVAGCGYAGSALAVRAVSGAESTQAAVAAALAVPALGAVAFWLYSVSLERVQVATSTAALIIAETFVPAVLGVALLHDRFRPGWWLLVVFGMLLAAAGAVALARSLPKPVPPYGGAGIQAS